MGEERDAAYWLEKRCEELDRRLRELAELLLEQGKQIDELERAQAGLDAAIGIGRWAGPVVVGVVSIVLAWFH